MDRRTGSARRLETLMVAVPLHEVHLTRLRTEFPEIAVVTSDRLDAPAIGDADAVVARRFDEELLAAAPRLGWLQTGGAGVEGLPLRSLAARGVIVTNLSGVHAINIGEHVLAMMLAFARRLPRLIRAQAARSWRDDETHAEVFELYGQTLLLVGLGDIGLAIAERAAAFGMRVVGVRRRGGLAPPPGIAEVVPIDRLDAALGQADHVAISLPLTDLTRGLFDAGRLAAMRPGAFLYNVGRGGVVATEALIAALAGGHLGGAGLDVVEPEPLPSDSPLWGMPNVLITAHTSGATPRYWDRGVELIAANVARYRAGETMLNEVDPTSGY